MGFSTSDHKKTIFMSSSNTSLTLDEDDVTVYFDNHSYSGQLYLYINDSSAAKSFTIVVKSHLSSPNSYYPRVRFYSGGTYRYLYFRGELLGHVYKCYRTGSEWKVIDVNNGNYMDLYSDQFVKTTNNGSLYTIDGKLDTAKITSFNSKVDARINTAMASGNELYRDFYGRYNGSTSYFSAYSDGFISIEVQLNNYANCRAYNRSGEALFMAYSSISINANTYSSSYYSNNNYLTFGASSQNDWIFKAQNYSGSKGGIYLVSQLYLSSNSNMTTLNVMPITSW